MKLEDVTELTFELTSYCNAKCPQCQRFDAYNNLREEIILSHSSVDIMLRNLDLEKMTNLKSIIIEGTVGDPVMHPELDKVLDFVCRLESNPTIELVTNGSIRLPNWWQKLGEKQYKNLLVYFSLDGLEDTNHLYRVGVDYHKAISNACSFIEHGGNAIWKAIIFKHNQHQINKIKQTAKNLNFSAVEFNASEHFRFGIFIDNDYQWFDKWPVYKADKTVSHYLEYTDFQDEFIEQHSEKFVKYKKTYSETGNSKNLCPYLNEGKIFITYRNHVVPCCMMYNELYLDHPGAKRMQHELVEDINSIDITKHSLQDIFNHSQFYNNRLNDHFNNGPWLPVCAKSCKKQVLDLIR